MAAPTKQQEMNRRRQLVAEFRYRGVRTQQEIVDALEAEHGIRVTQRTISSDLKALDKQWQEAALQETAAHKAEITEQYYFLYREAIAAWRLSLEDKEATVQETVEDDQGRQKAGNPPDSKQRTKVQIRTEGQSGNPAHLRNAEDALKAIRDLWGLDAGRILSNLNIDLANLTDAQLQRIADGEDPLNVLAATSQGGD